LFSRFIGVSKDPYGLLFAEASDGNLQTCIDQHNDTIDSSLLLKWRTQATALTFTYPILGSSIPARVSTEAMGIFSLGLVSTQ
jgi:hypothetical protein